MADPKASSPSGELAMPCPTYPCPCACHTPEVITHKQVRDAALFAALSASERGKHAAEGSVDYLLIVVNEYQNAANENAALRAEVERLKRVIEEAPCNCPTKYLPEHGSLCWKCKAARRGEGKA